MNIRKQMRYRSAVKELQSMLGIDAPPRPDLERVRAYEETRQPHEIRAMRNMARRLKRGDR